MHELDALLSRFASIASPGPFDYAWSFTHEGGEHDRHLAFGSMIHGDEVGSLPAFVRVVEELRDGSLRYGGRATFFVGNPEAGRAGMRFLEADLNRVFVDSPPLDCHEGRRAAELKPILDACDVFVDFHQTILRTEQPFYICPFSVEGWHWARALQAARVWVTRHPGQEFSSGTMCADEYVRTSGRPGITVEMSQKGFDPGAEAIATLTLRKAMALMDRLARQETTLEAAAAERPDLGFFHTVHRESFATDRHRLAPGWTNFRPVEAESTLHAPGTPEMTAPTTGMVLFPKYPPRDGDQPRKPLPKEIYRIVQALDRHPLEEYADAL